MADIKLQRLNMVESQVRPSDVTDRRIPRAMLALAREAFVPEPAAAIAYMDQAVTVSPSGRALMAPRDLARLLQLGEIGDKDLVLVIGCATGYTAAVVARLAQTVVALESDPVLAAEATRILRVTGIDTVAVVTGDLAAGYPAEGPFDVIVLDGAVEEIPPALADQLKDGGRLVAIVVADGVGRATLVRRVGSRFDARVSHESAAPLLPGLQRAPAFTF